MSLFKAPKKVKCIISFFSQDINMLDNAEKALVKKLGQIDYKSNDFNFDETSYYKEEMGEKLFFRILSFKNLVKRQSLPDIKKFSWQLEEKFSIDKKRLVNIDPGILSHENFILATGKGYGHRIYLGKGVYADLTLIYKKEGYVELPWTYLNYKSDKIKNTLLEIRKIYHKQIEK